jgi:hypothetical protein
MKQQNFSIAHEFVEFIPNTLQPNVLYVSIPYATAAHICFCGCGNRVVTPISRSGWTLSYNGETVGLTPSVGNWGLPCRSHYFVTNGEVAWSYPMSEADIYQQRVRDGLIKPPPTGPEPPPAEKPKKRGFLAWLLGPPVEK